MSPEARPQQAQETQHFQGAQQAQRVQGTQQAQQAQEIRRPQGNHQAQRAQEARRAGRAQQVQGVRPAAPAARHGRGSPGFRRVNLALFTAGLATFALVYSTQPLLPLLSREFSLSPAAASLSVSVTTGALALAVIPLSSLSEAWGRVRMMTWSVAAAALLGALAPLSPSYGVLLADRAAEGVALAGVPAVAVAYLAEEVEPGSLGFAVGLYIAGNGIGGMGGRLLVSAVADVGGWRLALAVLGLASLGCGLIFRVAVPPSRHFAPAPPRPRALGASLAGHLADSGLLRLYAVALLIMGAFVTVYNYLGYRLLAAPFHLSQTVVGLIYIVYVAGTASSATAGRLVDRYGRWRILWLATVVTAAGLALTLPDSLWSVAVGLTTLTAGFFAAHSTASGWVGARAATARAQASSLYLLCYYAGSSLGGWLGGVAYAAGGWGGASVFVAALLFSAVAVTVSLRTLPARAQRAAAS